MTTRPTDRQADVLAAFDSLQARRSVWLAIAVMIVATAAAYSNSFDGVFLYDDFRSIRDNGYIRGLWPLSDAMSLPLLGSGETVAGRPVLSLSFALNRFLLGPEPRGYHFVNLLIHIAAGLVLFGLIRQALRSRRHPHPMERLVWLPLSISLIWLVHPIQTESVTYIVQRAESLAGFFYLLTLYASVRGFQSQRPRFWYGLAIASCAFGMGTKEILVTAPLLVLAWDRCFASGSVKASVHRHRCLYLGLAATWLMLALPLSGLMAKGGEHTLVPGSPLTYAATQPGVILYYLRLAIWPSPLTIHYNWPLAQSATEVFPYGAAVLILIASTFRELRRNTWTGFLGLSFFLILAPTSSVLVLEQRIQEHRMYLPLAAVVILIIAGSRHVFGRLATGWSRSRARVVGAVIFASVVATLSLLTHERNRDYQDEMAFWEDAERKRPLSATAHGNLAVVLEQRGLLSRANEHYELALAIDPNKVETLNNFGVLLEKQGNWRGATELFNRALQANPGLPHANFNVARIFERNGDLPRAAEHYERAIRASPVFALAHNNLGVVYERSGELAKARSHYDRALAIKPDYAQAHNNLGSLLFREGLLSEAEIHFAEALTIKPDFEVARKNLEILRSHRSSTPGESEQFRP